MRYLVKARLKETRCEALCHAIDDGSLGRGSIAGDEYLHNMREARVGPDGVVKWVETCFCATPLDEERPYWEECVRSAEYRSALGLSQQWRRVALGNSRLAFGSQFSRYSILS